MTFQRVGIRLLLLPLQIPKSLVTQNNTDLVFSSAGGQKSETGLPRLNQGISSAAFLSGGPFLSFRHFQSQ